MFGKKNINFSSGILRRATAMSVEQRCTFFLFSIVAIHVIAIIWIILSD
jgi:hypothetical protein